MLHCITAPLPPKQHNTDHFWNLQNNVLCEEGFHAFAFWWECFRWRGHHQRSDHGFSGMLSLFSSVPSLGLFSSSSCIQTEHSLLYGWAGFRIGHFLRHTHADFNPPMLVLSNMRKCSLTGWVGQVLSWKGSHCMTRGLLGIWRRLSSRFLTIQLHSHILVACPQVCVTQGSIDIVWRQWLLS